MEPELARKNVRLGLALLALSILLFLGSLAVAYAYVKLDDVP
jgi:hypothetical protein